MTRRVTGVRNMTLSDTPRFPTRRVPICDSSGIVKYHGSKSSTKLLISRSAREKTYSSFANHWRLGKPRHFVTLKTAYYLLSDKFCAFSVLDLLFRLKFVKINTKVHYFTTGLEKVFVKKVFVWGHFHILFYIIAFTFLSISNSCVAILNFVTTKKVCC